MLPECLNAIGRIRIGANNVYSMVYTFCLMDYHPITLRILQSDTFRHWLAKLKDRVAIARINARIRRLSHGHVGDCKYLKQSIMELRIDHGPGYRVYFTMRGEQMVLLLAGGDKGSQEADIERAIRIASDWRTET